MSVARPGYPLVNIKQIYYDSYLPIKEVSKLHLPLLDGSTKKF